MTYEVICASVDSLCFESFPLSSHLQRNVKNPKQSSSPRGESHLTPSSESNRTSACPFPLAFPDMVD